MRSQPGDNEQLDAASLAPPGEGFELYRHRNAGAMRTRGWHGCYWARRNTEGDYELRSAPTSLGEPSVPAGVFPAEAFERLYERVPPETSPRASDRNPGEIV